MQEKIIQADTTGKTAALSRLDAGLFMEMLRVGAARLKSERDRINALNVFPVPDGDTGDNMYMTIEAGCRALRGLPEGAILGEAAGAAAHGMLLGARGNSGVILSRIFAGVAEGLSDREEADWEKLTEAFACGVRQAYGAVAKPVEGTVLTVWREAVDHARVFAGENRTDLAAGFGVLVAAAAESLERTPELLPVLREAEVVDSGGAGLLSILTGMKEFLENGGAGVPARDFGTEEGSDGGDRNGTAPDIDAFGPDSELTYGYCTEFLLRLQTSKVDLKDFEMTDLQAFLNRVGDSVVAFRDGSVIKVHVHTMHPGEVLNYCQGIGEFLTLKIENMTLQHHDNEAPAASSGTASVPAQVGKQSRRKPYAVVAVGVGEGVKSIFGDLGADAVVDGGQCNNPSAQDFLNAFEGLNADTILVLPNNGNIILTAEQAAGLCRTADVRVIPTHSAGQGLAVLSMLDTTSNDTEAILAECREAMEGVETGEITRAVRDSHVGGKTVRTGDFIGIRGDDILTVADDRRQALLDLADAMGAGDHDVMTLLCGADATEADSDALFPLLQKKYPRTEVILMDGGQPLYDYLLVLE